MVYSQANQILGCALSPNNRGICKKTAIDNHAQETPLAGFAQNRLVPASVVAKKYYVVFKNEGGTVIGSGYYEPGAALNDPGVPSKTGHTGAWNNGYTGYATGDAVYSPVYTPISYTITIINDVTGSSTTEQWPYGSTPSLTPPTNAGYTFAGWSPAIQPVTGNATYHATYTADVVYHTVTFISDGSTYDTQSVAHGGYATEPTAPTKSGYTFTGWSPSVASTQINGDTTFTAQFTQDTPRVVMLANVSWRVAEDASGTPYNDPSNIYMTDPDYLPSDTIAVNVWFEPWYKDINTGVELTNHWTDPIATVDGVSVCHNDLSWSVTQPTTSTNGYWWWHRLDGGYNNWDGTIILRPIEVPTQDAVDNKPGRNWRASVQSESNKQGDPMYRDLWEDKIPLRFVGSYGGQTVVDKTIYIWVHYG